MICVKLIVLIGYIIVLIGYKGSVPPGYALATSAMKSLALCCVRGGLGGAVLLSRDKRR